MGVAPSKACLVTAAPRVPPQGLWCARAIEFTNTREGKCLMTQRTNNSINKCFDCWKFMQFIHSFREDAPAERISFRLNVT